MRLINTGSMLLEEFMGGGSLAPKYAILSHTWEQDEVTLPDFLNLDSETRRLKKGWGKIEKTCELARKNGLAYAWVDTCCIDKSSSAELTEAINSMYQWYKEATVCYAWLADLSAEDEPRKAMKTCRWLTRGWTLQELIAPRIVEFYNADWQFIGTKNDLNDVLSDITKISSEVLQQPDRLHLCSVAQRMSWAGTRQTTRVEDMAYCLLGIFDVNMPMLYGEGTRAFLRLQEEIARDVNDLSLFAWRASGELAARQQHYGLFAPDVSCFSDSGLVQHEGDTVFNPDFILTNKGVQMTALVYTGVNKDEYLMQINCSEPSGEDGSRKKVGLRIKPHGGGVYSRVDVSQFGTISAEMTAKSTALFLLRRLSAARSAVLETSYSDAFVFRRNFNESGHTHYPDFPMAASVLSPKEGWDSQRRMFATPPGGAEFTGCAIFAPRRGQGYSPLTYEGPHSPFVIAFGKADGPKGEPWITVATATDGAELFGLSNDLVKLGIAGRKRTVKEIVLKSRRNKALLKLTASLTKDNVEGQDVYCIDLNVEDIVEE